MELVVQYRLHAEECRKLSAKISQSEEKQALESMARAWERVAEREARLLKQIETRSGFNSFAGRGTSEPTD
jgi:hypothetical protein